MYTTECIVCGNQTPNGFACDNDDNPENKGRNCWNIHNLATVMEIDKVASILLSMPIEVRAIWLACGGHKQVRPSWMDFFDEHETK